MALNKMIIFYYCNSYSDVLKYFFKALENDLLVSSSFLRASSNSALCCSGKLGASLPAASSNNFISLATSLEAKHDNGIAHFYILLLDNF